LVHHVNIIGHLHTVLYFWKYRKFVAPLGMAIWC